MRFKLIMLAAIVTLSHGWTHAAGKWVLSVRSDTMTDKRVCALGYRPNPNVFYTQDDILTVSYLRRGNVASYRYRVDQERASGLQTPPIGDGYIKIQVWYSEFMDGKTLKIEGMTVTDSLIKLDIDITGLKAARAAMAKACNLAPLPKEDVTGYPPDIWPSPPAILSGGD